MQACVINARLPTHITHSLCRIQRRGPTLSTFQAPSNLFPARMRGLQPVPYPPTHMQISGPSKPVPPAPSAPRKIAKASAFESRRSPEQLRLLCSAGKSGLDTPVVSFPAEGGAHQTVPDACASGLACKRPPRPGNPAP